MRKVHMSEQEDVKTETAEPTVETTPSVAEATDAPSEGQETAEIAEETPIGESTDTAKVNDVVSKRVNELNEKYRSDDYVLSEAVKRGFIPETPQTQDDAVDFDDPTRAGIRREALNLLAEQRMNDFLAVNRDKLIKDPLLDAAFRREMDLQKSQGMINPETAYKNAQKTLEERLNMKAETARTEGLEEGKEIAKTKAQLGAVGETGKQPEVDVESLSAAEYAKALNIPRDDSPPSL